MKSAVIVLALALLASVALQPYAKAVMFATEAVLDGTWTFIGNTITGQGLSSKIVSAEAFPSDRTFQVKMKTLVAGSQTWYVAWMVGKYVDECNRVHFLIHTNGFLELPPL